MQFEWDDEKNRINKKKHGISFETAAKVFTDPRYIEILTQSTVLARIDI